MTIIDSKIRTRIAPAPTGRFHFGTARTALFNYLFAKKQDGNFILRIEDTDIERSKPEFEQDIIENLKWLGIEYDEGPDIGGEYGPYRQTQRLEIHKKYLQKLLDENKAYYCFCSKEEIESHKQYLMSIGQPAVYSGKCRNLDLETAKKYLIEGKKGVIRFKVPIKKIEFEDLIRGKIEFDASLIGDFIIAKNLNFPLYNFAVVVDDYEMKINHIIRGEEHLSNTPKQILIQEALDFQRPHYAHLPLILGQDKTKLSKRHNVISISEYRENGYLPEALINFIAFLGWNPGIEKEIYSLQSLIKEFSIERIQKSGAIFNIKKLNFLNGFYIRQKSIEKITELCLPYLIKNNLINSESRQFQIISDSETFIKEEINQGIYRITETNEEISLNSLQKIISIYQDRLENLSEISEFTNFFFKDKLEYHKDLLKWKDMSENEIIKSLDKLEKVCFKIDQELWTKENLEKILLPEAENFSKTGDRGYLLWPLRVALTGKQASAGPFEIAEILGKEKTLKRIKDAKEKILQ